MKANQRVSYFTGEFLSVDDFRQEQAYQENATRILNRSICSAGVFEGFEVSNLVQGLLQISPGTALDDAGRLLMLNQNWSMPYNQLQVQKAYDLIVAYGEALQPASSSKDCDGLIAQPIFSFVAAGSAITEGLILATVTRKNKQQIEIDAKHPKISVSAGKLQFSGIHGDGPEIYMPKKYHLDKEPGKAGTMNINARLTHANGHVTVGDSLGIGGISKPSVLSVFTPRYTGWGTISSNDLFVTCDSGAFLPPLRLGDRILVRVGVSDAYMVRTVTRVMTPSMVETDLAFSPALAQLEYQIEPGNVVSFMDRKGDALMSVAADGMIQMGRTATGNPALSVNQDGQVGVGLVSSGTALQVAGTLVARAFEGDGSGLTDLKELWRSNGVDLTYDKGFVGIGIHEPEATLDVAGGLRFAGVGYLTTAEVTTQAADGASNDGSGDGAGTGTGTGDGTGDGDGAATSSGTGNGDGAGASGDGAGGANNGGSSRSLGLSHAATSQPQVYKVVGNSTNFKSLAVGDCLVVGALPDDTTLKNEQIQAISKITSDTEIEVTGAFDPSLTDAVYQVMKPLAQFYEYVHQIDTATGQALAQARGVVPSAADAVAVHKKKHGLFSSIKKGLKSLGTDLKAIGGHLLTKLPELLTDALTQNWGGLLAEVAKAAKEGGVTSELKDKLGTSVKHALSHAISQKLAGGNGGSSQELGKVGGHFLGQVLQHKDAQNDLSKAISNILGKNLSPQATKTATSAILNTIKDQKLDQLSPTPKQKIGSTILAGLNHDVQQGKHKSGQLTDAVKQQIVSDLQSQAGTSDDSDSGSSTAKPPVPVLSVLPNQRVGINQPAPRETLDVNGRVLANELRVGVVSAAGKDSGYASGSLTVRDTCTVSEELFFLPVGSQQKNIKMSAVPQQDDAEVLCQAITISDLATVSSTISLTAEPQSGKPNVSCTDIVTTSLSSGTGSGANHWFIGANGAEIDCAGLWASKGISVGAGAIKISPAGLSCTTLNLNSLVIGGKQQQVVVQPTLAYPIMQCQKFTASNFTPNSYMTGTGTSYTFLTKNESQPTKAQTDGFLFVYDTKAAYVCAMPLPVNQNADNQDPSGDSSYQNGIGKTLSNILGDIPLPMFQIMGGVLGFLSAGASSHNTPPPQSSLWWPLGSAGSST